MTHTTDDTASKRLRHERIVLRMPQRVEHPDNVDLVVVAEIIRSGDLTAEIDAANNYDPEYMVWRPDAASPLVTDRHPA